MDPFIRRGAVKTAKVTIKELMGPMMAHAKREGLVLWNRYTGLSFTPQDLEKNWKRGKFLWGPVNWELRRP